MRRSRKSFSCVVYQVQRIIEDRCGMFGTQGMIKQRVGEGKARASTDTRPLIVSLYLSSSLCLSLALRLFFLGLGLIFSYVGEHLA